MANAAGGRSGDWAAPCLVLLDARRGIASSDRIRADPNLKIERARPSATQ